MTTKVSTRKTFLLKMWEDYPRAWKFLINFGILLKYKTLNINKIPNRIVLPSSNILYVNSEENRGRALLISDGMTQKRLTQFWCNAVEVMRPDLTIDVGVNYGECIFSTIYPKHTKIYGVEANRNLLPYIKKSKEAHPNKSQITIFNIFAADKDGEEKSFYVDKHWSGTSSASYVPAHNMVEKVQVKSITIDSIIKENVIDKTILFKVDVEGYEAFVLKGMKGLFEKSASMLGFIEFNSEYIEKTGISINDFMAFLTNYFTIYIYNKNDRIVKASHSKYEDLQNMFGSNYIHTDLILATDEKLIDSLGLTVE
ncbi:FkbM family methyltransferase [Metabacillus litoralis]|jgi:FkbM family methyltransferase|uniref:FkbM family methyltransferase n=1 Tax=Metabacillus litoralis TaxID=152268 RepID=UPI00203AEF77|nr:FkbM family methyltransferase [Metabacillus litoralis]MCM3654745.1 FkbM family methyltransferase [Metabacillus litoralis]